MSNANEKGETTSEENESLQFDDVLPTTTMSCNLHEPSKKPDFTKYHYRLSERKCLEYMWEMNNRIDELNRIKNCPNMQAIFRGESAEPAEYPHMGAVGWWSTTENKWKFLCGSSLISPNFVLTAGHCTSTALSEYSPSKPSIVRFGVTNIKDSDIYIPTIDVNIKNIISEPNYDPHYKYFDIALLELDRELKFNKYLQPACLWSKGNLNKIKKKKTVTGWGATDKENTVLTDELKFAQVKIVKSRVCKKLFKPYCHKDWCNLHSHQICAGNVDGGGDTCFGDSGGPLQFKLISTTEEGNIHMIIGVTSFGMSSQNCGQEYTPGIYTKVNSFIDWIESIVWPGEE